MTLLLQILVGGFTLGLPLWFAYLDRNAFPDLKWIGGGKGTPAWGHAVVFIGVALTVLIALAAPIAGFHVEH